MKYLIILFLSLSLNSYSQAPKWESIFENDKYKSFIGCIADIYSEKNNDKK